MPVVILWFTIGFLVLAGGLVLGELSLLELIEFYVLELVLFAVGSYLLFRARRYMVTKRLPEAVAEGDELRSNGDSGGQ